MAVWRTSNPSRKKLSWRIQGIDRSVCPPQSECGSLGQASVNCSRHLQTHHDSLHWKVTFIYIYTDRHVTHQLASWAIEPFAMFLFVHSCVDINVIKFKQTPEGRQTDIYMYLKKRLIGKYRKKLLWLTNKVTYSTNNQLRFGNESCPCTQAKGKIQIKTTWLSKEYYHITWLWDLVLMGI